MAFVESINRQLMLIGHKKAYIPTIPSCAVELVFLPNPKTPAQEQECYEHAQGYCKAFLEVQEVRISLQPPPFHFAPLFFQIII